MFEPQDGVVPKDDALIRTIDLSKDYMLGTDIVKALTDINFQVYPGQFVAIVGRSGSGKTTLLNIMAGLDKPTSGSVVLRGKDIGKMWMGAGASGEVAARRAVACCCSS